MANTTLQTLIKQASQSLEELQKELVEVRTTIDLNEQEQNIIKAKMQSALKDATQGNDALLLSSALYFHQTQEEMLQKIIVEHQKLSQSLEKINDLMREKFAEKKQFEILLDRHNQEKRHEFLKKNQQELDDISQKRH